MSIRIEVWSRCYQTAGWRVCRPIVCRWLLVVVMGTGFASAED